MRGLSSFYNTCSRNRHQFRATLSTKMDEIRKELVAALRGGQAYDTVQQIVAEVPEDQRYKCPDGMEHSAWQILEHMRVTLEDLCAYSTNFDGQYRELEWPKDYWPTSFGAGDDWDNSLAGLARAEAQIEDLVSTGNLTQPFSWEPSHCLLREIILAIEHAAYHAGELVELTRQLT
jgi:hypothetical protein